MSRQIILQVARQLNRVLNKFNMAVKPLDSTFKSVRKKPYNHLRLLSFSQSGYFSTVADYTQIDDSTFSEFLDAGCGMLLYEPEIMANQVDPTRIAQYTRTAKKFGTPSVLVVSSYWHENNLNISRYFDLICVVGGKNTEKKVIPLSYSVDANIDNPIGLDYSSRKRNILVPYSADKTDKPNIEFAGNTQYLPINASFSIHNQQAIEKQAVNNTWVGLIIRKNFSSDTEYVTWAIRLAANGVRTVVDNASLLPKLLQDGVLPQVSVDRIDNELDEVFPSRETWERIGILQTRTVLGSLNRANSLEKILEHLSIEVNSQPLISILAVTKRPEYIERMIENTAKQKNVKVEIKVGLHDISSKSADIKKLLQRSKNIQIEVKSYPKTSMLGEILRDLANSSTGDYIAKMDDDDYYGEHHLYDLLVAHSYVDAAIVGKWSNFVWFEQDKKLVNWRVDKQEVYVPHLPGATWLGRAELIRSYGFSRVRRSVDSTLLDRLRGDGYRLYSTHRFNFVRSRHSDHTYKTNNDKFIKDSDGRIYNELDEQIYTV